jgi:hypothetical protein
MLNKTLKPALIASILASATLFISTAQAGPALGDTYEGGTVFYVSADGQHGLIAAPADLDQSLTWDNDEIIPTGATRDGVYGGGGDTAIIIAKQIGDNPNGKFAALSAADYHGAGYGDWYLPSKAELVILVTYGETTYADIEGQLSLTFEQNGAYWSSTEDRSTGGAWSVLYSNSTGGPDGAHAFPVSSQKSVKMFVRPIRAF